jgi:NAD-dependent deacetylase
MDKEMVLNFYNQRRRQLVTCEPNAGHHSLAELEADFDVTIITQNVDDLHERAGSTNVLHLHGELLKARSTADPSLVYELKGGQDILLGDKCTLGSQLRPHIVWFGEDVTAFPFAVSLSQLADIMVVVGTSLAVYPANTLIEYAPSHAPVFIVDPSKPDYAISRRVTHILEPATTGLPKLSARLRAEN